MLGPPSQSSQRGSTCRITRNTEPGLATIVVQAQIRPSLPEVIVGGQPQPAQDHVRFVLFAVAVIGAGHRHPAHGEAALRPDLLREG